MRQIITYIVLFSSHKSQPYRTSLSNAYQKSYFVTLQKDTSLGYGLLHLTTITVADIAFLHKTVLFSGVKNILNPGTVSSPKAYMPVLPTKHVVFIHQNIILGAHRSVYHFTCNATIIRYSICRPLIMCNLQDLWHILLFKQLQLNTSKSRYLTYAICDTTAYHTCCF